MAEEMGAAGAGSPEAEKPGKGSNEPANRHDDLDDRIREAMDPILRELDNVKKDNSGKDKRINDLIAEKRKLQQATLSQEELLKVRMQEVDEKEKDVGRLKSEVEDRAIRAERELTKFQALMEVPGFPMEHAPRILGDSKDEIILDAKKFMKIIIAERDKISNARKIAAPPRTGEGRQMSMTREQFDQLSSDDKVQWAKAASQEEVMAVMSAEE